MAPLTHQLLPDATRRLTWSLIDLTLGDLLGEGIARKVYACRIAPQYVIKLEYTQDPDFQNVAEWEMWHAAPARLKKWLAPVYDISTDGKALLMARCDPCPEHMYPKRLPKILDDMHRGNIGLYEGRPVAMDYGRPLAKHMAANAAYMTKASRL